MGRSVKFPIFPWLLALAASAGLLAHDAAAAEQPAVGSSYLRQEDHKLATMAYRLARAGTAYCPHPQPLSGLLLHHLADYRPEDWATMLKAYPLDRGPGVLAVVAESPAARAGLVAGDVIVSWAGSGPVNPRSIAAVKDPQSRRRAIESSEEALNRELQRGPVDVQIIRGREARLLRLRPEYGCPSRVRLARSSQTNAFAGGQYVVVTTALLNFVRNEDELAVAFAHELAHNILDHPARLRQQGVPRGFLRGIGKNASRVRATEEEADRLGVRLMSAAGYDVGAAIPFWERFYAKFDSPQIFRTHPSLRTRKKIILQEVGRIRAESAKAEATPASPPGRDVRN